MKTEQIEYMDAIEQTWFYDWMEQIPVDIELKNLITHLRLVNLICNKFEIPLPDWYENQADKCWDRYFDVYKGKKRFKNLDHFNKVMLAPNKIVIHNETTSHIPSRDEET